jgi:hypothetical protein
MKALEWGTGSSTQWTLMRVGHLTSVEHDAGWAPTVRDAVGRAYDADFLAQVQQWVDTRHCSLHHVFVERQHRQQDGRHPFDSCNCGEGSTCHAAFDVPTPRSSVA